MIVYKITNIINGKIYIGKDSNNDKYYYGSGVLIKKAIKKYGKKNFVKEILEICNSEADLNKKEIYWISYYKKKLKENCYNIGEGGEGSDNLKNHPDREKILENNKKRIPRGEKHHNFGKHSASFGIKWSDESKKKLSESLLKSDNFQRTVRSAERNDKISKKQKGVSVPSRGGKGEKNPMYGKKHSKETKNKISNSISHSEVFKIAMLSKERSRKLSEKSKYKVISEEQKNKIRGEKNGMFGKTHTDENKKKMSFPLGKNPRAKKIITFNLNGDLLNEFDSVVEAGMYFGMHRTTIGRYAKEEKEIKSGIFIKYKK